MGLRDRLRNAKPSTNAPFIVAGKYILELILMEEFTTRAKNQVISFRFKVLDTLESRESKQGIKGSKELKDVVSHEPDEVVKFYLDIDHPDLGDQAETTAQHILCAMQDIDPADKDDAVEDEDGSTIKHDDGTVVTLFDEAYDAAMSNRGRGMQGSRIIADGEPAMSGNGRPYIRWTFTCEPTWAEELAAQDAA